MDVFIANFNADTFCLGGGCIARLSSSLEFVSVALGSLPRVGRGGGKDLGAFTSVFDFITALIELGGLESSETCLTGRGGSLVGSNSGARTT